MRAKACWLGALTGNSILRTYGDACYTEQALIPVTGKEAGQSTEEQAVFRTMQDLDRTLRSAGVNAETISRMGRRLERGEGFLVEQSRLATERLFPQHRRL